MSDSVSTNVRLPRDLLKTVKLKAVEEGKSMGQVFREALLKGLNLLTHLPRRPQGGAGVRKGVKKSPFAKIVGLGESGVPDGALHHDASLYGKPKFQWKS